MKPNKGIKTSHQPKGASQASTSQVKPGTHVPSATKPAAVKAAPGKK
jgi:hypothetical protein